METDQEEKFTYGAFKHVSGTGNTISEERQTARLFRIAMQAALPWEALGRASAEIQLGTDDSQIFHAISLM